MARHRIGRSPGAALRRDKREAAMEGAAAGFPAVSWGKPRGSPPFSAIRGPFFDALHAPYTGYEICTRYVRHVVFPAALPGSCARRHVDARGVPRARLGPGVGVRWHELRRIPCTVPETHKR